MILLLYVPLPSLIVFVFLSPGCLLTFLTMRSLYRHIYRQFYYNSFSFVLIKLHLTLTLPILMYSYHVWDPYSIPNININKSCQNSVVKIRPLIILYFCNSLIFLLYPLAEQHPSLSFYTSLFIVKQNISYIFYNYHEYNIHIVHIYLLIHLSISSLIINPLLLFFYLFSLQI